MPLQYRLFAVLRKADGTTVAHVEAGDQAEAAARAAYVIGRLLLLDWEEVEVVEMKGAPGAILTVPTFLDPFFRAVPPGPRVH